MRNNVERGGRVALFVPLLQIEHLGADLLRTCRGKTTESAWASMPEISQFCGIGRDGRGGYRIIVMCSDLGVYQIRQHMKLAANHQHLEVSHVVNFHPHIGAQLQELNYTGDAGTEGVFLHAICNFKSSMDEVILRANRLPGLRVNTRFVVGCAEYDSILGIRVRTVTVPALLKGKRSRKTENYEQKKRQNFTY